MSSLEVSVRGGRGPSFMDLPPPIVLPARSSLEKRHGNSTWQLLSTHPYQLFWWQVVPIKRIIF